ncbi:MAG: sulfotransferase [Cyanobacteria bacterium]|jgi:hypothetical protein|nr:sulfotransferase [Cyanobacteria bacterium GSL.Bin1]
MKKPNLFIVGAPKCGTTAMYSYLQQHPEIFMPETKEPHFFGSDFNISNRMVKTEQEYLSLFTEAQNEKIIGDGSIWLLYSDNAPLEIKEFSPDAKILVMLRNPVDMIQSLHSNLLYVGYEKNQDLETAIEEMEKRKQGVQIPGASNVIQGLSYREVIKYAKHLKKYLDVFSPNNIKIIVFDDFRNRTELVYYEMLEFLEINKNFQPNLEVINPNKEFRNKFLQNKLNQLAVSPITKNIGKFLPNPVKKSLYKNYLQIREMNTIHGKSRSSMEPSLRKRLQAEFAPEVEKISSLLNRDLTHWIQE